MITRLSASQFPDAIGDLTDILHACVHDGASIGFVLPFSGEQARAYWQERVFPVLQSGGLEVFIARQDGQILGTLQLVSAQMPNQRHRADVAKLLVHPKARRRGLGVALMRALEARARSLGKTLLVLDTRSSDPSRILYQNIGFETAGEIPDYCRSPAEERLEPTTYMYKALT